MRYTVLALLALVLGQAPAAELWHEVAGSWSVSWSMDTATPTAPPAEPITPDDGDGRGTLDPDG